MFFIAHVGNLLKVFSTETIVHSGAMISSLKELKHLVSSVIIYNKY